MQCSPVSQIYYEIELCIRPRQWRLWRQQLLFSPAWPMPMAIARSQKRGSHEEHMLATDCSRLLLWRHAANNHATALISSNGGRSSSHCWDLNCHLTTTTAGIYEPNLYACSVAELLINSKTHYAVASRPLCGFPQLPPPMLLLQVLLRSSKH